MEEAAEQGYGGYTVQDGDTLGAISEQTGIPINELEQANPQIADLDLIRPGDVVNVPLPSSPNASNPDIGNSGNGTNSLPEGGGSLTATEVATGGAALGWPTIKEILTNSSKVLPSLGSTAAIGLGWLIPTDTGGDDSTYNIEGVEDLRISYNSDETTGQYQQMVNGEWVDSGVFTQANINSNGEVTGFEPVSDADAERLNKPYINPEQTPLPTEPGGLEPPAVDGSGNMENPQVDDSGPYGPEGFPADSGVPDIGVVNSEGADDVGATNALSNTQVEISTQTAQVPYKGSTVVGHALSKHAGRNPEIWGTTSGSMDNWNDQAMIHFDEIMDGPGQFNQVTDNGVTFLEKRLSDGRGIRLNMDFTFKGFID
jgi:murein DD-endopeptidase MepM/ murein hydrolase activator NlpD